MSKYKIETLTSMLMNKTPEEVILILGEPFSIAEPEKDELTFMYNNVIDVPCSSTTNPVRIRFRYKKVYAVLS